MILDVFHKFVSFSNFDWDMPTNVMSVYCLFMDTPNSLLPDYFDYLMLDLYLTYKKYCKPKT